MPADLQTQTFSHSESLSCVDADYLTQIVETQADVAAVSLDLDLIIELVSQRMQRLTGAAGACVQLLEGDHLVMRATCGAIAPYAHQRLSLQGSLAGIAVRTQKHAYCKDALTDERVDQAACRRMGFRSFVVVPLVHGSDAIGVLNVMSPEPDAFSFREIAALRLLAGVVSAAIAHSDELEAKRKLLSERVALASQIQESDERFRSAFAHAAIGMALVGLDGRWLQVNPSVCQIVGYPEADLLATDFQSITHPDDLDMDLAYVRQLIAGSIPNYQMVKRYIHRQGQIVWVLLSVSLVHSNNGRPLYFISQIQDITRRKDAETALRASEEEYRATFELASVGKVQVDLATGRFLRVNNKMCQMLGYTSRELLARTFFDLTHPEDVEVSGDSAARLLAGEISEVTFEKRYRRKDGSDIWVQVNSGIIRNTDGQTDRAVGTLIDITSRKRAEWLERDRRNVLEMVARDLPLTDVLKQLAEAVERQLAGCAAVVMVLDDGGVRLHEGPACPGAWKMQLQSASLSLAAALSNAAWQEADGCGITSMRNDDVWAPMREQVATCRFATCWGVPISGTDGAAHGILAVFTPDSRRPSLIELQTLDMAGKLATICVEHHLTTRQLGYMVRHDNLTGLPNRIMFDDRLRQAITLARRNARRVALLALDIDKFKSVNDTLGHDAGDQLLQQFAHRLGALLRETDTMARMGGDEFLIVLPDLEEEDAACTVARKIVAALENPFDLGAGQLRATSSIGIAIFPEHAQDAVSLQKHADLALYLAKERGRNGYALYDSGK